MTTLSFGEQEKLLVLLERGVTALESIAETLNQVTGNYFSRACIKVLQFKQVGV